MAVLVCSASLAVAQQKPAPCDRACLEGIVQQYLDALVAHNPFGLPLAAKIKFSENDQLLEMGDGLWNVTTGLGTYRLILADPQAGQAGFLGTVKENDVMVGLALRLKVENRRITEIESLVVRDTGAGDAIEAQGKPDPGFLTAVPPAQRVSRAAMIAAADKYWDGIEQSNGNMVPFDADCNRVQNGAQTTNNPKLQLPGVDWNPFALGCREQLNTKFFAFVARAYPRRHLIVDEERQALMSIFTIQVPGDLPVVDSPGHGKLVYPGDIASPYFIEAFEAFKLNRGKIHRAEALQTRLPYGTPNPFFKDTWRSPRKEK